MADRALTETLPEIRVGVTERELAMALEWRMRTGGAEGLAFEVACLSGPRAALPHGSPGGRGVARGEVLLFDFGAQVDGYRSDMTRTLFVGEPTSRDLEVYAPAAFPELDDVIDAKPSRVRTWTLVGGLVGAVTGYALTLQVDGPAGSGNGSRAPLAR